MAHYSAIVAPTTTKLKPSTAFCPPARDLSAALDAVGAAESPGALESAVGWARSSFRTAQATAPAALRGLWYQPPQRLSPAVMIRADWATAAGVPARQLTLRSRRHRGILPPRPR